MADDGIQSVVLLLLDIEERIDNDAVLAHLRPDERVIESIRWSASGGHQRFRAVGNRSTVVWSEDLSALGAVITRCLTSLRSAPSCKLVICAYAPLPMMLYLGVALFGYAHRIDVVNLPRPPYNALRVSLDRATHDDPVFRVEGIPSSPSSASGAIALYVSTAPIANSDVTPEASILNAGQQVAATVRVHPATSLDVTAEVMPRAVLQLATVAERLNHMFPTARDLVVFLRGPVQLAIALGRSINTNTWARVRFGLHQGAGYTFPVEIPPPSPSATRASAVTPPPPTKTILHLSDLHITAHTNVNTFALPLLNNLREPGHPAAEGVDYLVITGDITNRATEGEFKTAAAFVKHLATQLKVPLDRVLVVPGNHDLSRDVPVYQWRWQRELEVLPADSYHTIPGTDLGGLWRDPAAYPKRFENYANHFYKPLFGKEWELDPTKQFDVHLATDRSIAFVTLNSACEVDEMRKENAYLNEHAVSAALQQLSTHEANGVRPLAIAAWHHPASEKTRASGLLDQLADVGAKICLHGHVHEERLEFHQFVDARRRIYAVGAGSLGAPAKDRPASTPRLYNVVRLSPHDRKARVHVFSAPREHGPFRPYAQWPSSAPGTLQNWYDLDL